MELKSGEGTVVVADRNHYVSQIKEGVHLMGVLLFSFMPT